MFPKYGIYKDLLAGKIGGVEHVPSLCPVLVKKDGVFSLAFQADRLANGVVVAYLQPPDAWSGSIALVTPGTCTVSTCRSPRRSASASASDVIPARSSPVRIWKRQSDGSPAPVRGRLTVDDKTGYRRLS